MIRKRRVLALIFGALLMFLMAAPVKSVTKTDLNNRLAPAGVEHWMGTDSLGRDVFSLVAGGCKRTLEVVGTAALLSLSAGTLLGLTGGYYGGAAELMIRFVSNFLLILPSFITALVFMGMFGFSPVHAGIVLGITGIGGYCQQVMILTKQMKQEEFILEEQVIGIRDGTVILRHILPNIKNAILTYLGNNAASAVVSYAGLAYIGLGTDVTAPDWGSMIYQNRLYITTNPGLVLWPALGILLLALFFHLMFDDKAGGKKVNLYE